MYHENDFATKKDMEHNMHTIHRLGQLKAVSKLRQSCQYHDRSDVS
jgi:hypothetical protein